MGTWAVQASIGQGRRCPKTPRCPRAAVKLPTWAVQASIGQGGRCPKTPRCPRAAAKLPTWAVQASIGQGRRGGARKHPVAQGRRQSYQLGRCKRQLAKGGGARKHPLPTWAVQASIGQGGRCPK